MIKFRKKPVVIVAVQWFKVGDHSMVSSLWHPDPLDCELCGKPYAEHGAIRTLEDTDNSAHIVCPGDWIITGIKGEHYACKPDIFAATYEQINEPPQVTEESPLTGSCPAESDVATPASGSPDGLVGRLERWIGRVMPASERQELDDVLDEAAQALRALEADRSVLRQQLGDSEKSSARDRLRLGDIKKVCESLQSELDRIIGLLRRALDGWACADHMGLDKEFIAQIRSAIEGGKGGEREV